MITNNQRHKTHTEHLIVYQIILVREQTTRKRCKNMQQECLAWYSKPSDVYNGPRTKVWGTGSHILELKFKNKQILKNTKFFNKIVNDQFFLRIQLLLMPTVEFRSHIELNLVGLCSENHAPI